MNEGPEQIHLTTIEAFPRGMDAAEAERAYEASPLGSGRGIPGLEGFGFSGIFSAGLGARLEFEEDTFQSGRVFVLACFLPDREGGNPRRRVRRVRARDDRVAPHGRGASLRRCARSPIGVESAYLRRGRYGSFRQPAELDRPGAKTAADTVDRAEAAQKVAAEMGGSLEIYWTMGQYDMVAVTEFADDETAVAFLAKVSSLGNVRSQTMRAFDADAVKSIMGKM